MIRIATRSDLKPIASLLVEFVQESSYANHTSTVDEMHIRSLVLGLLHMGTIWLYEEEGKLVGLLAAIKEANMWMPNKRSLREVVWYVKPEYRKRSSGGKLFVHFTKHAESLKQRGEIEGYFTTRMATTADFDLESRGFRLVEKMYLKD